MDDGGACGRSMSTSWPSHLDLPTREWKAGLQRVFPGPETHRPGLHWCNSQSKGFHMLGCEKKHLQPLSSSGWCQIPRDVTCLLWRCFHQLWTDEGQAPVKSGRSRPNIFGKPHLDEPTSSYLMNIMNPLPHERGRFGVKSKMNQTRKIRPE